MDCWVFILAKTPLVEYLDFVRKLDEDKKASSVATAHLLHQGAWLLFFLDFFKKDSALS